MNIIQENNRVITTKKGNVKLPLFCGNVERVIPIKGQTQPQVMTLIHLIHLRTVIIDVDDAKIRNIRKRIRSDYAQL